MQLHVQKHYIQFALKCILTTPIPNKLGRCVKFKKKQNSIYILHSIPIFLDFGFYKFIHFCNKYSFVCQSVLFQRVHIATYFRSSITIIYSFLFIQTDRTGCGSRVINVTEAGLTLGGSIQVNCNVEESGTGESVKQTAVVHFYCLK